LYDYKEVDSQTTRTVQQTQEIFFNKVKMTNKLRMFLLHVMPRLYLIVLLKFLDLIICSSC